VLNPSYVSDVDAEPGENVDDVDDDPPSSTLTNPLIAKIVDDVDDVDRILWRGSETKGAPLIIRPLYPPRFSTPFEAIINIINILVTRERIRH
jgi:hypothetical protein